MQKGPRREERQGFGCTGPHASEGSLASRQSPLVAAAVAGRLAPPLLLIFLVSSPPPSRPTHRVSPPAEKQHRNATAMLPLLLPLPVTPPPPLPSPTLTLAPASAPRRRLVLLAAAAPHHHHHHRRRRVYRRQRAAPTQTRAPRRTLSASNAARGEEDLEEAIYEFMRRSDKPGRSPPAPSSSPRGGRPRRRRGRLRRLAPLGWSSGGAEAGRASSSVGVHPDYPPEAGAAAAAGGASDLAQGAVWASSRWGFAIPFYWGIFFLPPLSRMNSS